MCRNATPAELELVDKEDDVTTILVDDDKWDELASDTPQGAYSRKPIMTLCFAMFANSVALTNVFPYAGFWSCITYSLRTKRKSATTPDGS